MGRLFLGEREYRDVTFHYGRGGVWGWSGVKLTI